MTRGSTDNSKVLPATPTHLKQIYSFGARAPINPASHINLYRASFEFTLVVGILEIIVLVLRVMLDSPVQRKAETIENIVFWLGSSYLIITYLVNMTIAGEWLVFWGGIILNLRLSPVSPLVCITIS
jgi:hypothetical protein